MSGDDDIILGIDLGTTFSAMAYVNRYGKPEVIVNSEGRNTTPSVMHFYDEDACVVGDEAMKMVVIDPHNVVRFIKRHMGQNYTKKLFERSYSPQELSALILRKLKEDAEEILGTEIRDAVITVPAYFNSAQRGATSEAGAIAGLNVLSIINEPTAAAIAYGLERIGGERKLLVFDLGGGTFDVPVMQIRGTKLTTLSSDGNAELGGKDWDDLIVDHVAKEFIEKFGADPRKEAIAYQELYERSVLAKITLSTKDRAVIPVNFRGNRHACTLERSQFEALSAELIAQCEHTANVVLEKAKLKWPDLDEVLLVGGSTRMPMVKDLLRRLSGKEPDSSMNPDECVAVGAALAGVFRHRPNHSALRQKRQAIADRAKEIPKPLPAAKPTEPGKGLAIGLADGGSSAVEKNALPDVTIEDATTHPLGIIVLDRDRKERVVELVPEGTRLPHEFSGRFAYAYENMTAVRVEVTEGVGYTREDVAVIGKVELTGLPPRPRGTPIEVTYSYGVDQILQVRVIDVETGASREVAIRFKGGMSRQEIESAKARQREMMVD